MDCFGLWLTIILFVCVRMCMRVRACVCVGGLYIFISMVLLFGLYIVILWWIMYELNLWRFHLNIKQLQSYCALHVSSCYFAVLLFTGLRHKTSHSCSFPSTLEDICSLRWWPCQQVQSRIDKVERNLISSSLCNILDSGMKANMFKDISPPSCFVLCFTAK